MGKQDFGDLLPVPRLVSGTQFLREIGVPEIQVEMPPGSSFKKLTDGDHAVKITRIALRKMLLNQLEVFCLFHAVVGNCHRPTAMFTVQRLNPARDESGDVLGG